MDVSYAATDPVRDAYPVRALFAPFPFVCFTLTLLTDIAYWRTSNILWQDFSDWLLFAGLIFGALALLAGAIDLLRPATRARRPGWLQIAAFVLVLCLAFLNSLVHAGDGWTAVVPYGLILSAATVLLLLVTIWLGRLGLVSRRRSFDR